MLRRRATPSTYPRLSGRFGGDPERRRDAAACGRTAALLTLPAERARRRIASIGGVVTPN